jgi:endo-1,4-beta-xylanase
MMTDAGYCSVAHHDFNLGAISAFTDARLWLGPNDYNFAVLDQQVNNSVANGMTVYASHLVWGSYETGVLPEWLKNGNYSKDQLLAILHDHITTLVTRYRGVVKIWSIANEAAERDRWPGADFWYDHIGPEYIQKSFEWARQADPNAILILNSYNNESPRDTDTTYIINTQYQMVKTMLTNGVRVDAVGMQMHLFLPWSSQVMPKEADVEATMRKFGELGVKVMITEMDVDLHEIRGTPQQKLDIQTQLYADMMTACINSGVCTAFMTWGIGDAVSWITSPYSVVYKTPTPDAAPLMFDINYQPKPAYFAVLEILEGK